METTNPFNNLQLGDTLTSLLQDHAVRIELVLRGSDLFGSESPDCTDGAIIIDGVAYNAVVECISANSPADDKNSDGMSETERKVYEEYIDLMNEIDARGDDRDPDDQDPDFWV